MTPFPNAAAAYLHEHELYHGAILPDGDFALATLTGGLVILDHRGELVDVLDRATGLPSNDVAYTFVDRERALWLAQPGGLTRVDVSAPLSAVTLPEGSDGMALSLVEWRDRLFVGTSQGVDVVPLDGGATPPITRVDGLPAMRGITCGSMGLWPTSPSSRSPSPWLLSSKPCAVSSQSSSSGAE